MQIAVHCMQIKETTPGLQEKLKKCSKQSITTDSYNNIKVIEFYIGLGYNIYYDFVAYRNRKMYRMIKDLKEQI